MCQTKDEPIRDWVRLTYPTLPCPTLPYPTHLLTLTLTLPIT